MNLMKTVLKTFINEALFNACSALLHHLHIVFNEVTREPVRFEDLYPLDLPKALNGVLAKVEYTYFIGTVDESSLSGGAEILSADDVTTRASEGKYTGMMIFAVELQHGATLTRSESATLTRGFNRIASAQPVILFIKQGNELALSTCERSEYTQQWRDGEKLGKVSILRGINCLNPHRGHIDILASIGDKTYPNYEELYKHWMQVFSSDLLTKKFYSELSDWYAWAVQVVRFPNDLTTDTDDDKFNHESCIRLITRLIFVCSYGSSSRSISFLKSSSMKGTLENTSSKNSILTTVIICFTTQRKANTTDSSCKISFLPCLTALSWQKIRQNRTKENSVATSRKDFCVMATT